MVDESMSFIGWAVFAAHPAIGARTLHALRRAFAEPADVRRASRATLRTLGLDETTAQAVIEQQPLELSTISAQLARDELTFLWYDDPRYPEQLKTISDPPACLYVRGTLEPSTPALAVVGSRKATSYGRQVAASLTTELVQSGLVVVSGLAFGIDAIAHQATLDCGGRTIAVLPSGLDAIYPASHRALGREIIAKGGALVSEFPPGTPALRHHFPIRNRIIAGLSLGTLVIEAAEQSGSLLTARSAIESGREVFAVPGPITSPVSVGPHGLIRLGATLVTDVNDILAELRLEQREQQAAAQTLVADSPIEAQLLSILTREPIQLDALVRRVDRPAAEVSSALLLMEMKGRVRNLGGHQYVAG